MKGGDLLMNLEEYYDDIYRYCFFRMQDHSLAEDLTQEAFLKFWRLPLIMTGESPSLSCTPSREICVSITSGTQKPGRNPSSTVIYPYSAMQLTAPRAQHSLPLHPSRSLRTHQLFWFRLCRPSVNPTGRSSACAMYWS